MYCSLYIQTCCWNPWSLEMKMNSWNLPVLLLLGFSICACTPDPGPTSASAQTDAVAETSKAGMEEPAAAPVSTAHPGEALYQANCAACHDEAMYKAPSRLFIGMMGSSNILHAMNEGLMSQQAADIDATGRRAIAEYLGGQSLDDITAPAQPPTCDADHGFDPSVTPVSAGQGAQQSNTRFFPASTGKLTLDDMATLEVKWTFAYPNAIKARSQPAYGGGAIYFGSHDGTVRALDARTGCLRWSFKASAEVRTAIVISPWSAGDDDADPVLYFGDLLARAYAISARTGELRWMVKVDEHRDATITGAPALSGDQLFVPVSSLEVVPAMDPGYACCTFRGSVVALNAATGEQIWKTHTVDQAPVQQAVNSAGTPILAPSGAPVWNTPTIDTKRSRLYFGTGENYSSPADGNSDAIMALDMNSGKKIWVSQQTSGDAWNTGCLIEFTQDDANCPEENGPDYDFGSSPILLTTNSGRELIIGGQKSGNVMAIDPDSGETLWKTKVGRGGVQGGVHFGMAAESGQVYVPINDMAYPEDITRYKFTTPAKPGLYSLNTDTGELFWATAAPEVCEGKAFCNSGISQAIAAIPGAVIAGHMDGHLRIYRSDNGSMIWELDSLQEFTTVSGATARGGSFSGIGGVVAGGMLYINSGYGLYNHMPGNLLLALGPAEPD
jgi:polyvinyl alcohol dehydrogenase (cytochrome)